jgi:hypothetical protein
MSIKDLVEQARKREEERQRYWQTCEEQRQQRDHEEKVAGLKSWIGYNFGQSIERDLGLCYEWSQQHGQPIARFEHDGQTYTISVHGEHQWYVGQLADLCHYGEAGQINNRDIAPELKRQRYDRLLIAIGRAIESIHDDELPL